MEKNKGSQSVGLAAFRFAFNRHYFAMTTPFLLNNLCVKHITVLNLIITRDVSLIRNCEPLPEIPILLYFGKRDYNRFCNHIDSNVRQPDTAANTKEECCFKPNYEVAFIPILKEEL